MKKIIATLSVLILLASCKKEAPKDYVTLSGTITNQNSDSLIVAQRGIIKTIKVNQDGTFKDTLKVDSGNYVIFDGKEQAQVYLKNGYDLNISVDTKAFDETLKYEGMGAEANNYLIKKALMQEKLLDFEALMGMDKPGFDKSFHSGVSQLKELLSATKNLDSSFVASEEKQFEMMAQQFNGMYDEKQAVLALNGKVSPKFIDYENYTGGTTSLDDLKGKYVYIDLWATWCGPCKKEIPYLKEVEKAYHDKNIEFVSISMDRKKAYNTWKNMVKEKELSGVQLWANEDNAFAEAYKVSGIPRFILIDPDGNIVNADAPRPSNSALMDLFKSLNF